MAQALVHDPLVPVVPIRLVKQEIPSLSEAIGQVLVRFLMSPVNRVDFMVLRDQYPTKPQYTADGDPIPGFDGVGVVLDSTSSTFQPGDVVLPKLLGIGTWRTHAVYGEEALIKLPKDTPPLAGAFLRSGMAVAWLLLEKVTPLQSGDWIIASAGTSVVSHFLLQLAKLRGIHTILVIRDRKEADVVKTKLINLGAAAVLTESELARAKIEDLGHPPTAAFDSVFGAVGQFMTNLLAPGGKYVLVGMLAGNNQHIQLDVTHLFYRRLSFLPFRSSEYLKAMGDEAVEELLTSLARLCADGKLKLPDARVIEWVSDEEQMKELVKQGILSGQSEEVGYQKTVWKLK